MMSSSVTGNVVDLPFELAFPDGRAFSSRYVNPGYGVGLATVLPAAHGSPSPAAWWTCHRYVSPGFRPFMCSETLSFLRPSLRCARPRASGIPATVAASVASRWAL
jgi:hypothetical protein